MPGAPRRRLLAGATGRGKPDPDGGAGTRGGASPAAAASPGVVEPSGPAAGARAEPSRGVESRPPRPPEVGAAASRDVYPDPSEATSTR